MSTANESGQGGMKLGEGAVMDNDVLMEGGMMAGGAMMAGMGTEEAAHSMDLKSLASACGFCRFDITGA